MKIFILLCLIILPFAYGEHKIQTTKMSWQVAQKACKKWGGNLATISSLKANAYLIKKLKASGLKEAWIGYNDLEKENSFKWISGASNGFTNWSPSEPNNGWGDNEDCTEIVVGVRNGYQRYYGRWNDRKCATQLPSICQKPEYKIQITKMSWQVAQKACEKWGGNLATISSLKTNAYLIEKLKASELKEAWIGYNDLKKENSFKWITSASNGFTNWSPGEPSNGGGDNEDCTEIVVGVRNGHQHYYGRWNDRKCATQLPSICQKPF